MKNKKKTSFEIKPSFRRNIDKKLLLKKKIPPSNPFPCNLDFIQKHSKIFAQNLGNCGDAETYFKAILRNYDHVDLKEVHSEIAPLRSGPPSERLHRNRSVKSVPLVKDQHQQTKSKEKKLRSKLTTKKSQAKVSKTPTPLQSPLLPFEEARGGDEIEVFYSPSSHTLGESSQSSITQFKDGEIMAEEDIPIESMNLEEAPPAPEPVSDSEVTPEVRESDVEESDDELKEVEKIIKQASNELEQVAEENQQLLENLNAEIVEGDPVAQVEEELPPTPVEVVVEEPKTEGGGSFFKFDPKIDAAVLRELEEAEKQAKATAKVIYELKSRVTELMKKEKCTEIEARELEQKNRELKQQMMLFEEKTKRIQFLIGQSNLFESMMLPKTPLQSKHKEDLLPKVIVCGMTENNMPKLIVCDDRKRRSLEKSYGEKSYGNKSKQKDLNIPMAVVPKFAKHLNDSYCMQEKLANENADLEGMRYKLQSDLLNKDQTIECLQKKLCSIQTEMRVICKENSQLNTKIEQICTQKPGQPPQEGQCKPKRQQCGKGKGPCPNDIEHRLNEYQETTQTLEKQLIDMEEDVKNMQGELQAVQTEREHLEKHKKIIICPAPMCMPPPCSPMPSPCGPGIPPCALLAADCQLRELREQYNRLQDDFKGKVTEVAALRADNEKLKDNAREAEEAKKLLEDKMKECERTLKSFNREKNSLVGSKEALIEQEQQLIVAKQRFREAQDELEELRAFIQDQQGQMDDYRNKYLEAQQLVEEQKRHIDILEMDATRVNEQVNLEIQRVKNQFQEKLQELLPLPELLKTTQIKLQEAQQMHLLAERNNEAMARDLQMYKEKVAAIMNEMDQARNDQQLDEDQKASLSVRLEELERKYAELQDECDTIRDELKRAEELCDEKDREVQQKMHEIAQLAAQLESVREESARQVSRNKERCETVRRSMQNQIFDLERQLAQSRAQARSAQKDRDEIRQKMQSQINNLHENFEDAQMRIRNLQGHVNFLKDSYNNSVVPGLGDAAEENTDQDPCHCGVEF